MYIYISVCVCVCVSVHTCAWAQWAPLTVCLDPILIIYLRENICTSSSFYPWARHDCLFGPSREASSRWDSSQLKCPSISWIIHLSICCSVGLTASPSALRVWTRACVCVRVPACAYACLRVRVRVRTRVYVFERASTWVFENMCGIFYLHAHLRA